MQETKKSNIKLNFFWQLCIEITNMLLPLITSPIISRRLGVEPIGIYSYVYSISYYFVLIACLGIFQYGTREIALVREDKKKLNERFTELFYTQLGIGFIVILVYYCYVVFFAEYKNLFLIQSISLIGSSIILVNWLFSGLEEFKLIALKTMIVRIIGVLLIVVFVNDSNDLTVYTLIMALEPLAGSLVYIVSARKKVSLVKIKVRYLFTHIKGMSFLFIPLLTTYVYSSMDKIMLGKMSSMTELGFYENATKALIAKNLATALSTVLVPRMANLIGQNDKEKFNNLFYKSIEIVFLLTVAFGFGTAAVSNTFSIVFWGKNFEPCGILITIMSLTLPAYGLTYVINNQILVPLKREKIYIISTLCGVVINFFLNYMLIPQYNAIGASIATLMTQYIVLLIECYSIRKEFAVIKNLKKSYIYVFFGIIMLAIVRFFEIVLTVSLIGLVLEVVLGGMVFLILCCTYWMAIGDKQYLNMITNFVSALMTKMRIYKKGV